MELPGQAPPAPSWGQQVVGHNPELARRIQRDAAAAGELTVVLGAGGAFGPDVVRAQLLRGAGAVVGVDVQLTYRVEGATYRFVDLADPDAIVTFFRGVREYARGRGLALGTVYDLSTVQTSPRGGGDRAGLSAGKAGLLAALAESDGDQRLFFMSTAEVYGAPEGAPYREDHAKRPFNAYGRAKWADEQQIMAAHGSATRGGRLWCVALRSWTIVMVDTDAAGRVAAARNYNDPFIAVAERLGRAGVRVPVVDPRLRGQFHFSEEVAEVAVRLGSKPARAATWGRPFNCTGRAADHGRIRDICFDVFTAAGGAGDNPWWAVPTRMALRRGRLPRRALEWTALGLERLGGLLGARDLAARLPFLYRSTDMDSSALQDALAGELTEPAGSATEDAVRRLALGIRNGGPNALNFRRYRSY